MICWDSKLLFGKLLLLLQLLQSLRMMATVDMHYFRRLQGKHLENCRLLSQLCPFLRRQSQLCPFLRWQMFSNKSTIYRFYAPNSVNLVSNYASLRTSLHNGASTQIVGLGWLWSMMFCHLAQLLSQFCHFPISPNRIRQRLENPKSKWNQPSYPSWCPSLYLQC